MRFFFPIIFVIVGIAGFIFFTSPTYQLSKTKEAELKGYVEANESAAKLRAKREELQLQRNSITATEIDRLMKMLPDGVENVSLIIEMNRIARQKGVSIRNARVNEGSTSKGGSVGPDGNKYGTISMSFGVTMSYTDFQDFLKALEQNLRLVDVTAITFATTRTDKYDYNITLQTYWLK
jgi:Tfp pilus assembly protein PilO